MTPERWQKAKEIFHSALKCEPARRSAFLANACGSDEALRKEVESLIAAHEKTGSFIDSPAYEAAAEMLANEQELTAGQTIGHYEILATLGKGGMGEVYLAQDTKLGRKVALKFLPTYSIQDPEKLRRFEQEAQAASALNHPNILTIHEIGEAEGQRFIATEYIDGETLRQRMSSAATAVGGPSATTGSRMKLSETLIIAEQVASALAAAHAAGIIHRDIKPENIMVRRDGIVKVLDFGLAKLAEQEKSGTEDPTRPLVHTSTGVVMGTVAYMSPEQARGLPVDARTDIWSLGVVIYEMLTGRAPFAGATNSDLIVSVLEREPLSLTNVSPETPEALEWIVTKALTKEREDRYQTARELLTDLRRLQQRLNLSAEMERSIVPELSKGTGREVVTPSGPTAQTSQIDSHPTQSISAVILRIKRNKVAAALALVIALGAILGVYRFLTPSRSSQSAEPTASESTQVLRTTQVTASPSLDMFPTFSPDGNSIAYSSDRSGAFEIYIKQLTPGGREIQLTSDGQQNLDSAWSPDGQRIAFYSKNRGGIWVIPALGGTAKQLTDFGARPAWSRDGLWIAFQSQGQTDFGATSATALLPSTIWVVSAQGGEPRQITQVANPEGGHGAPSWSPDGKRIVFTSSGTGLEVEELWSISAEGGNLKPLVGPTAAIFDPVYSPDGENIYYSGGVVGFNFSLWKLRVSPAGEPIGEPVKISSSELANNKYLAISADGKKIAYSAVKTESNLWSLPTSPTSNDVTGVPVALTSGNLLRNVLPAFSPDGKKIAYIVWRTGDDGRVWVIDADGKNAGQLTTGSNFAAYPSWSADGKQVFFVSGPAGRVQLWSISVEGGREKLLSEPGQDVNFMRASPDGKQIAFNSTKSGVINVWTAAIGGGSPKQLTFDKELAGFPFWSPDGQFIAFEAKRGEDTNLMLIPSGGGTPTQLTFDKGQNWTGSFSPDGDKILFAGQHNGVWNVYWVSRSTKQEKQLTHYTKLNTYVRYPNWSPLGNQIIYEYAETTGNIWMMELK